MKILRSENIKKADKESIQKRGFTSFEMMQEAMLSLLPVMLNYLQPQQAIFTLCGRGNNGGDGLVLSYFLRNLGFEVFVFILEDSGSSSVEFELAKKMFEARWPQHVSNLDTQKNLQFPAQGVIVDALFGSGLNRPLQGSVKSLVQKINASGLPIFSIDVPSGTPADFPEDPGLFASIMAQLTFCLQMPKETLFFRETGLAYGRVEIIDIGIEKACIDACDDKQYASTESEVMALVQKSNRYETKHNRGHACLAGGIYGTTGAVCIAAQAALEQGPGLVTVISDKEGLGVVRNNLPKVLTSAADEQGALSSLFTAFNSVGIGMGLGRGEMSKSLLHNLLHWYKGPMVLDADAINILAENKTWLEFLPTDTILTPHEKEFERLTGCKGNRKEKVLEASQWSMRYNVIIILKGAFTCISFPDGSIVYNMSGNPGLAQGGSGDMLTGYIAGILARGYSPGKASILGVYLHGAGVTLKDLEDKNQYAIYY
jgi:NAD(P)H-hydrate epimerase